MRRRNTFVLLLLVSALLVFPWPVSNVYAVGETILPGSISAFNQTLLADTSFFPDGTTHSTSNDFADDASSSSPWVFYSPTGDDAEGSDGDIITWTIDRDANPDTDVLYNNGPALSAGFYYYEFRYCHNTTIGSVVTFYGRTADYPSGNNIALSGALDRVTDWATIHGHVSLTTACEAVYFTTTGTTQPDQEFYVDYVRMWEAGEPSGWQHDCSSADNVTSGDWPYPFEDGDALRIGNNGGSGYYTFDIDTSPIQTWLIPADYPFLELSIINVSAPFYEVYVNDGALELLYNGTATGILRLNVLAACVYDSLVDFSIHLPYVSNELSIDYLMAYSIVNYTLSESSTGIDDYLYVSGGHLRSNVDTGSWVIDNDPALSIEVDRHTWYNMSVVTGGPEIDFYESPGGWYGYTSTAYGSLYDLGFEDLIDVRLRFAGDAELAAVLFVQIPPEWHSVGTGLLEFFLMVYMRPFDVFFVILGLVMIPTSTMYLVRGGRQELSTDKVFLALVIFFVGWSFLLGGILT